jgi:gluconokinase
MAPRRQRLTTIVLMGVAGSGKSTVMAALVERLGWAALEGDSLHPESNVEKMLAGRPLTDEDRWPWLDRVAAWIGEREAERASSIVACSALKRAYRDRLRAGHPSIWFVHLAAPARILGTRIERRDGHFMPRALLQSQLETLEPLGSDEPGWMIDSVESPAAIADRIAAALRVETD